MAFRDRKKSSEERERERREERRKALSERLGSRPDQPGRSESEREESRRRREAARAKAEKPKKPKAEKPAKPAAAQPAAEVMFERMVEAGELWLADQPIKSKDPRAYAAVLVAMKMGMFLMREQLSRVLDVDLDEPAHHARMLRASVEIFAQPLLDTTQADQAYAALDRLATPEES